VATQEREKQKNFQPEIFLEQLSNPVAPVELGTPTITHDGGVMTTSKPWSVALAV
jgi:hypothetical protein